MLRHRYNTELSHSVDSCCNVVSYGTMSAITMELMAIVGSSHRVAGCYRCWPPHSTSIELSPCVLHPIGLCPIIRLPYALPFFLTTVQLLSNFCLTFVRPLFDVHPLPFIPIIAPYFQTIHCVRMLVVRALYYYNFKAWDNIMSSDDESTTTHPEPRY
jgi:hypothetical protein